MGMPLVDSDEGELLEHRVDLGVIPVKDLELA
jgi:hypothetical protein